MSKKVWLITGCSTGFGREIALAALARGDQVVVTARKPSTLDAVVSAFPVTALALELDVTDGHQIEKVVTQSLKHFGHIDVLVNNAGYGYVAAVEEGEINAVRDLFETNFFGALAMTQAVIPSMRRQGGGRIINNSSQAGIMANPGTGYYSASKHALEGLMEALGKELEPFNIQVCSVQPGAFRTDWAGRSMQRNNKKVMSEYAEHVGSRLDMIAQMDGKQPGDPVKGAQVFLEIADCQNPPAQLLLGKGVLDTYRQKLCDVNESIDRWEALTVSAEFDA